VSLTLKADPVSLTLGRFAVNYSVTNIFTPNDFFAPFSATAINTVYKPGVDALRFAVAAGSFTSFELVRVLGYDDDGVPTWGRSALLGRSSTVLGGIEWALLGGKLAERWIVGASAQGELGPIGLRCEGHAGFADRNGDGKLDPSDAVPGRPRVHGRLSAGLDVPFEWHNTTIGAEYEFLSDGASAPDRYLERWLARFPDDPTQLGQHYVGASVRGEIIPILRAAVLGMLNPADYSGLASVSLSYSIADEAEFVGGVLVPWGERPTTTAAGLPVPASEYGLLPLAAFGETRFYF
jgi:hypothetical protein